MYVHLKICFFSITWNVYMSELHALPPPCKYRNKLTGRSRVAQPQHSDVRKLRLSEIIHTFASVFPLEFLSHKNVQQPTISVFVGYYHAVIVVVVFVNLIPDVLVASGIGVNRILSLTTQNDFLSFVFAQLVGHNLWFPDWRI